MVRGAPDPHEQSGLKSIQQLAEAQRENALDLLSELSEQPKEISQDFYTTIQESADFVANRTRNFISFSFEEQTRVVYSKKDTLVNILRQKIESFGVMVIKNNDLQTYKARGMCLAKFPLPVIVWERVARRTVVYTFT